MTTQQTKIVEHKTIPRGPEAQLTDSVVSWSVLNSCVINRLCKLACIHPEALFTPVYLQTSRHQATAGHSNTPPGCVYQSRPCDHTWPRSKLLEANNTSHVQVSMKRSFDGGYWEFRGGAHAGIPGVPNQRRWRWCVG